MSPAAGLDVPEILIVNRTAWLLPLLLAACEPDQTNTAAPSDQTETKIFETQDLRAAIDHYHDKPTREDETNVADALAGVDARIKALAADLPNVPESDRARAEEYIEDLKHSRQFQWNRYLAIAAKLPTRAAEPVVRRHSMHGKPEAVAEHAPPKKHTRTISKHTEPD